MNEDDNATEQMDAKITQDSDQRYFIYPGDPQQTGIFDIFTPHQGVQSFMRLPVSRQLDDVDIAIYGLPLDLGTVNRPGARLGPRAIREHSLLLGALTDPFPPHTRALREELRLIDYGDLAFEFGYIEAMLETCEQHIGRIVDAGIATLGLGGDHLGTYPALKEHARRHGTLSLVHFDAHSDDSSIGKLNHGSMFRYAIEEGMIDPQRSIQVGVRHTLPEHDFNTIPGHEVIDMKGTEIAERIHQTVGDHPCYITLDVDGMDPAFTPGTGTPVPGGMTSMQQRQALWGLKSLNAVGADVVEVSPPYDPTGQTANIAAGCAIDLLQILAEARITRGS